MKAPRPVGWEGHDMSEGIADGGATDQLCFS
jgi:hypothetical protein